MWKFLSRGIRESLERRGCRTNLYSQSSPDNGTSSEQKRVTLCESKCLAPRLLLFHGFCGDTKHLGPKDKEKREKYDANYNNYETKYTWSEAVGLSSILAVGYVVCQSLCIRRKLFEIDNVQFEHWRNNLIVNPRAQASKFFTHLLLPQPKYILPLKKGHVTAREESELLTDDASYDVVDCPSNIEQKYGPITAEEAFKEAVNEFASAHETMMGEVELNNGAKAIEDHRYEEAIEHFIEGSKLSSIGSMFNLGLCYELGLGTSTDYEKAVEYYQKAADGGHADAMYNLGVFYAQGKGGLKTNVNVARQLFTKAANKGQNDASKALELERSFKKVPKLENNTKYSLEVNTVNNNNLENNVVLKLMNYNILMTELNNRKVESDQFTNSYDNHMNIKSPTDMFLDMIGVHERSAIPFISIGESGP